MRVILKKSSWVLKRKCPVGTVMVVSKERFQELGDSAEEYKGQFPPKKKHKLNLSQLKK